MDTIPAHRDSLRLSAIELLDLHFRGLFSLVSESLAFKANPLGHTGRFFWVYPGFGSILTLICPLSGLDDCASSGVNYLLSFNSLPAPVVWKEPGKAAACAVGWGRKGESQIVRRLTPLPLLFPER